MSTSEAKRSQRSVEPTSPEIIHEIHDLVRAHWRLKMGEINCDVGILNEQVQSFAPTLEYETTASKVGAAIGHSWLKTISYVVFPRRCTIVSENFIGPMSPFCHCGRNTNTLLQACDHKTVQVMGYQWETCNKKGEDRFFTDCFLEMSRNYIRQLFEKRVKLVHNMHR